MPVVCECTHCNSKIETADRHAGSVIKCPKCGRSVAVLGRSKGHVPDAATPPLATSDKTEPIAHERSSDKSSHDPYARLSETLDAVAWISAVCFVMGLILAVVTLPVSPLGSLGLTVGTFIWSGVGFGFVNALRLLRAIEKHLRSIARNSTPS